MIAIETMAHNGGQRPLATPSARRGAATAEENGDAFAIDLLRHLDPDRLILYDGRRVERSDWERHRRQRAEYALVATSGCGAARCVAGTLEFRRVAGTGGGIGMIDRLYVDPRHRRRGIASRLLRALIAFARERGLTELRENIPNILVRDRADGWWSSHTPVGDGWGGLRSLGATANACAREGQPCAILQAHRCRDAIREPGQPLRDRIDATLALPLAPGALAATPRARVAASGAALSAYLLEDLAIAADVTLRPTD